MVAEMKLVAMTWDLETTASICRLQAQVLRNWVAKGWIKPILLGSKGRGRSHRFSSQQVLGLIFARAVARSPRGCSHDYFFALVRQHAAMTEAALAEAFNLTSGEYEEWRGEEALAQWVSELCPLVGKQMPTEERLEALTPALIYFYECTLHLREAIVRRMGWDRMKGQQRKKSKRVRN